MTLNGSLAFEKSKFTSINKRLKIGPVSLNFITIIIISVLALFYLVQSQQSSAKAYRIKAMDEAKMELISQNESLQVQISQLKSIDNIKNTAEGLGMVPSVEINYLKTNNTISKK
ncbi:MAG TPA: hypothetical protein VJJ80_00225 [Patescibacteria group bacterium]|nr:hypothetical protein [Patescibacteria group bacterium]